MKVLEVHLKNIKAIESLHWQLPKGKSPTGWHVILGDNGSGKSSFLRAVAIGFLGLDRSAALWLDYNTWLRQSATKGAISLTVQPESEDEVAVMTGNAPIMVMGVGREGFGIVKHMNGQDIKDVEFVVCDTDKRVLESPDAFHKIYISNNTITDIEDRPESSGKALTSVRKQFRAVLGNGTKMLVLIADMGNNIESVLTSIIAQLARDLGILTIGVAMLPFEFEKEKNRQVQQSTLAVARFCETFLLIPNEGIRALFGKLPYSRAFTMSNELVSVAARVFVDLLNVASDVTLSFWEIEEFLKGSGVSFTGSAIASGENRALIAAESAFNSPMLRGIPLKGANRVLLSIASGNNPELEMDELTSITEYIQEQLGEDAEMVFGHSIDTSLNTSVRVTVIVSGLPKDTLTSALQHAEDISHITHKVLSSLSTSDAPSYYDSTADLAPAFKVDIQINKKKSVGVSTLASEGGRLSDFRKIWGKKNGWFSAGFGPLRRFTGGDSEYDKLFHSEQHKRLAAHLSLFKENVSFAESVSWLKQLKLQSLEDKSSTFLSQLQLFVNQPGFLPHGVQMDDVSSEGVFFKDNTGTRINLDELSDGFRSVLSLTFELLRQLENNVTNIFEEVHKRGQIVSVRVHVSGVVLIDEIDAHLHPVWQKQIGYWFVKHFPNIQFFVTTHSPLVCQAAEQGSVFHLPRPGTDEEGGMVTGTELQRLIYGNILEAYGTEVFGLINTQSNAGQEKTHRLTELNELAMNQGLSDKERKERDELRSILPITDSEDFINNLLSSL